MNLLFICSRNQWRSPTAERIWSKHPGLSVRSAGTSSKARKTVSHTDITWADIIFTMEKKHKNQLLAQFPEIRNLKRIEVLDIPDDYQYMDDELVELLTQSVALILGWTI